MSMSLLFTQENNIKEETLGISSSSTSREDHKVRHKSRHMMNMTPKAQGPKHEAVKLQGPKLKMLKLVRQGALSKPWRIRCQGPTCIREQVSN
jgi:hypothetical protein